MRPATKQLLEYFDDLLFEINFELRRGDVKAASRVVDDIKPEYIRTFTWYVTQMLHEQNKQQARIQSLAKLVNVN
jgi:hypothetical protein